MKTALKLVLLVLLATAVAALLVASLRVGKAPQLAISPSAKAIGMRGSVVVTATAPGGRGLADLRVEVEQQGKTTVVARERHEPRPVWAFWGPRDLNSELTADVGRNAVAELRDGEAIVRAVAERAPTWIRRPDPVVAELKLPVRLAPPALSIVSTQHYVAQGGSGVVVYRVGETAIRDGVRCGSWFFPGTALPGASSGERFALFGVPWDMNEDARIRLIAEDAAGNFAELAFVDQFFPKPPTKDRIELEDAFLERVTAEILPRAPGLAAGGSALESYLVINRELRARNARELVELSRRSEPRFLWKQPFLPLRNAQVMSSFADQRSYVYQGREVDQQTHLGYDLAVTARTPVTAANDGIVRLADYFGIYGNTVVLDHGFGLATLYSHLSTIDVKTGQTVARGDVVGRTGRTGLAGGDHLHFTTLVGGLPVRPTEWWDPHWIRDRVAARLAPAVVFEGEAAFR
jgi:murein DD-endopeptidase MepM/ murein hydrolase activator NlpD